jgi:hypothetical protein
MWAALGTALAALSAGGSIVSAAEGVGGAGYSAAPGCGGIMESAAGAEGAGGWVVMAQGK